MTTTSNVIKPNWIISLGLPLLVAMTSFFVTQTAEFRHHSELLSNALLADMLLIAPFLYYLSIRKSAINKATVFRVFVLSLFFVGLILDSQNTFILHYIKTFVYPLIEIGLFVFIGRSFYLTSRNARKGNQNADFLTLCREVMYKVIGNEKVSAFFASEIAAFYYAFTWSKTPKADYKTTFSVYKETGIIAVLYVLIFVVLIETAATHLLLGLWNEVIAWLITGLSLYTCLQLFAHIRAVKIRHIEFGMNYLKIYNGLATEVSINYDNIEKFELSNKIPQAKKLIKTTLLSSFEEHNVILYLKKPVQVSKFFGIKKSADTILFHIDQAKDFLHVLTAKLTIKQSIDN